MEILDKNIIDNSISVSFDDGYKIVPKHTALTDKPVLVKSVYVNKYLTDDVSIKDDENVVFVIPARTNRGVRIEWEPTLFENGLTIEIYFDVGRRLPHPLLEFFGFIFSSYDWFVARFFSKIPALCLEDYQQDYGTRFISGAITVVYENVSL